MIGKMSRKALISKQAVFTLSFIIVSIKTVVAPFPQQNKKGCVFFFQIKIHCLYFLRESYKSIGQDTMTIKMIVRSKKNVANNTSLQEFTIFDSDNVISFQR
jgi:hypothetical protein